MLLMRLWRRLSSGGRCVSFNLEGGMKMNLTRMEVLR